MAAVMETVISFLAAGQNNPRALRKTLNDLRVVGGRPAGPCCCMRPPPPAAGLTLAAP
jgi:hypothetical protein